MSKRVNKRNAGGRFSYESPVVFYTERFNYGRGPSSKRASIKHIGDHIGELAAKGRCFGWGFYDFLDKDLENGVKATIVGAGLGVGVILELVMAEINRQVGRFNTVDGAKMVITKPVRHGP